MSLSPKLKMELASKCYKSKFPNNVTFCSRLFHKLPKSLIFYCTNVYNYIYRQNKTSPISLGQKLKKELASEG